MISGDSIVFENSGTGKKPRRVKKVYCPRNYTVSGPLTFNLRFPGQYYDVETALHYNVMRDYDPSLGRYIQSDPIGLQGGWNNYAYALGNPIELSDFTGRAPDLSEIGNPAVADKVRKAIESAIQTVMSCLDNPMGCPQTFDDMEKLINAMDNAKYVIFGDMIGCGTIRREKRYGKKEVEVIVLGPAALERTCCPMDPSKALPATIAHEAYHLVFGGADKATYEDDAYAFEEKCFGAC